MISSKTRNKSQLLIKGGMLKTELGVIKGRGTKCGGQSPKIFSANVGSESEFHTDQLQISSY